MFPENQKSSAMLCEEIAHLLFMLRFYQPNSRGRDKRACHVVVAFARALPLRVPCLYCGAKGRADCPPPERFPNRTSKKKVGKIMVIIEEQGLVLGQGRVLHCIGFSKLHIYSKYF